MTRSELENELQPILKLSQISEIGVELLIDFIEDVIENMYSTIKAFEDESNPQIQRLTSIKKDKDYLNRYIESFEHMAKYYHAIGEEDQENFMKLSWMIFKAFQKNSDFVLNGFAENNTFLLSNPDIANIVRLLNDRKKHSSKEKAYIQKYNEHKQLKQISKFFEGYNITRKGIVTSASIYMYRSILMLPNMQKHTLKDVIESIFVRHGESVTIYPAKMNEVYLKTFFQNTPIFSYPSKNEKLPYFDVKKVTSAIEKKIKAKLEKGKIYDSNKLQRYFENVVTPLKQRLQA